MDVKAVSAMNVAVLDAEKKTQPTEQLREAYRQSLRLIERLHRLMLDVIKVELERLGVVELNSVQALLLHNIGESELTVGELRSRGYYLGSNASYNIHKLADLGYIDCKRSTADRRSVRIRLTDKGKEASSLVNGLCERQLGSLEIVGELGPGDFAAVNAALTRLEGFWVNQIRFRL